MKGPHHVNKLDSGSKKLQMLNNSSSNYTSLLPTNNLNGINNSNSQPNISANSNTVGLPSQPPHFTNNTQLSSFPNGGLRNPKLITQNPYTRTSNHINGMLNTMNTTHHQYSNVVDEHARFNVGVYSASHQNNNRNYKTSSLGDGSSSSGVVSTGGSSSSPGHSPVGSVSTSNQVGTHVWTTILVLFFFVIFLYINTSCKFFLLLFYTKMAIPFT